jgi:hypothetical protein
MLIEFFIAAARSVPDSGDVSMVPARAKSNLEEGLIRAACSTEKRFRSRKIEETDQLA